MRRIPRPAPLGIKGREAEANFVWREEPPSSTAPNPPATTIGLSVRAGVTATEKVAGFLMSAAVDAGRKTAAERSASGGNRSERRRHRAVLRDAGQQIVRYRRRGGAFTVSVLDRAEFEAIEERAEAGDQEAAQLVKTARRWLTAAAAKNLGDLRPVQCLVCHEAIRSEGRLGGLVIAMPVGASNLPGMPFGFCGGCAEAETVLETARKFFADLGLLDQKTA